MSVMMLLGLVLPGCAALDALRGVEQEPADAPAADGDVIAVLRWVGGGPQVDLVRPDGGLARAVEPVWADAMPMTAVGADAHWSPDGQELAFTGYTGTRQGDRYTYSTSDVFVLRVADGALRRLTAVDDARSPVWTADGARIVYTREAPPERDPADEALLVSTGSLWIAPAAGGDARLLLAAPTGTQLYAGGFSPDGAALALTRCRSVPYDATNAPMPCEVALADADGGGLHAIAPRSGEPAWSPDGSRLAIVSDRDEDGAAWIGEDETVWQRELYVVRPDGSDPLRLTRTPVANEGAPSWAPDGSRIAYVRVDPTFRHQLRIAPAAGGRPWGVLAERGPGRLLGAVWRPG